MRHAPRRVPTNVRFLASALYEGVENPIVLGAEPFDFRVEMFKRLAKQNQVIYHTSWPFWDGKRVPHTPLLETQRRWWREFLSTVPTVAVTRRVRDAVEDFGGTATHIPHGVDTTRFSPDRGTTGERPTVLFVGRLVEEKGVRDLLAAVEQTDQSPLVQFVGRGPLSSLLEEYDGPVTVEYLGYVGDRTRLAELYASAHLHVLPSYCDGIWEELFGIVTIEAMAAGTPTVATDCVGPSEVVVDEETGIVVPQRDRQVLAAALNSLLDDDERRQAMGQQARTVALESYDLSVVADKWVDILGV